MVQFYGSNPVKMKTYLTVGLTRKRVKQLY